MLIFIDTNILFNNWYADNANFKYLFNYLENSNSSLVVSDLVCQEIDNKFELAQKSLKKELLSNLKRASQLLNKNIELDLNLLEQNYMLKNILKEKTSNIIFFPYSQIDNTIVTFRAIKQIKPFQSQDKGYRDTLIWLSFIEYLKDRKENEEVIFINNNSKDFLDENKSSLHSDLKNDLANNNLKNKFNIYLSLNEFVIDRIDKIKHKYTDIQVLEKYIYPLESTIEKKFETVINAQTNSWFMNLINEFGDEFNVITNLISYKFEIYEGIEDAFLTHWSEIDKHKLYIGLSFELRRAGIEFTIPLNVYESNKKQFRTKFYDLEINDESATFYIYFRPLIEIVFNLTNGENIEDMEIITFQ